VAYEVKDVLSDPEALQEMMERSRGIRSVPVTIVGDEPVRGVDKERIAALLGLV
jgi:glutaredoxin